MTAMPPPAGPSYASLTADDLVTGEAVALDLPAAGLALRMASGLIDALVTVVVIVALGLLLAVASWGSDEALQHVAYLAVLITAFLVVPTAAETLSRGRTLGKLALGLRTVRDDGAPISFQQAFTRALVGVVEIYLLTGVPAFFAALFNERAKRLGDHAAGTYVVRERVSLTLPAAVPMPPALSAWAAHADIAPIPHHLALRMRQLVVRGHDITPASRHALASRLADEVAAYVAPMPPPGTPPDAFLAAVIAARRERDTARLEREDAVRRRLLRRAPAERE